MVMPLTKSSFVVPARRRWSDDELLWAQSAADTAQKAQVLLRWGRVMRAHGLKMVRRYDNVLKAEVARLRLLTRRPESSVRGMIRQLLKGGA